MSIHTHTCKLSAPPARTPPTATATAPRKNTHTHPITGSEISYSIPTSFLNSPLNVSPSRFADTHIMRAWSQSYLNGPDTGDDSHNWRLGGCLLMT